MNVYLAGGMKSGWQEKVIATGPSEARFFNPLAHGLRKEKLYTAWDLLAIDQCDVVLIYFEADNPSGYGLCLEAGYARAKGKTIVLVDEKSPTGPAIHRYLGMLRSVATVRFDYLSEAVRYLEKLATMPWA